MTMTFTRDEVEKFTNYMIIKFINTLDQLNMDLQTFAKLQKQWNEKNYE